MIIAITNQKGGVAKSTTVEALASGLKKNGFKTLIVDLDPQGNISYAMNASAQGNTSYEVITGRVKALDGIEYTEQGDIIPANILLSGADKELISITGKEYRIKEALEPLITNYDYIIIDTPPALGTLTINALTAADEVIIPVGADIYSIQGVGHLNETIETVKKYCNPQLKIKGILLTRHNSRTILSKDLSEVIKVMAEQFGTIVYKTVIRESISVREAQTKQISLLKYAPKSTSAKDYEAFVQEFLGNEGK